MKKLMPFIMIAVILAGGYYGYKKYRLKTSQPPLVEVEDGTQITCVGCGKILERNTRTFKVPMTEAHKYSVKTVLGDYCEECKKKGLGR